MNKNNKAAFDKAVIDMSLGGDIEWFDYVVDLYDLRGYYEAYLQETAHHKAPLIGTYHNDNHMKMVVLSACEGALHVRLTNTETRVLLIAAMFHDANHNCGGIVRHKAYWDTDATNIDAAVTALRNGQKNSKFSNMVTKETIEEAVKLIRTTVFPRAPLGAANNEAARVLLDADFMTAYCLDKKVRTDLYIGLKAEAMPNTTMREFIDSQNSFATKVQWKTRWGRMKAIKNNWPGQFRALGRDLVENKLTEKID